MSDPEQGSGLSKSEVKQLRFHHLLHQIRRFLKEVGPEDFAMKRTPLSERTQFKHKHQPKKQKGGSPPKEFDLTEAYVDLQLAMDRGDYSEAIGLYYYLKRMLNR